MKISPLKLFCKVALTSTVLFTSCGTVKYLNNYTSEEAGQSLTKISDETTQTIIGQNHNTLQKGPIRNTSA